MAIPGNKAKVRKSLTSSDDRANMLLANQPAYLENEIRALPSVQADREYASPNGCHVRYCTKQRGGKAYHRPIYRCYNSAIKAKGCTGQTVYSAAKIEVFYDLLDNMIKSIKPSFKRLTGETPRAYRNKNQIVQR